MSFAMWWCILERPGSFFFCSKGTRNGGLPKIGDLLQDVGIGFRGSGFRFRVLAFLVYCLQATLFFLGLLSSILGGACHQTAAVVYIRVTIDYRRGQRF